MVIKKDGDKSMLKKTKNIVLWVILGVVLLELILRLCGFAWFAWNNYENRFEDSGNSYYRILCLGDSTTADIYGNQNSWPSQLEIILNNRSSGTKFKVFNEGIPGTNSAFVLSRLKNNLNKYKPNMVITMMGINDAELNIKYEENLKVKMTLLFEDLRIYKLSKLLLEAWKNKIQYNAIKDIDIAEESKLIKEEYREKEEKYFELGAIYHEQGKLKQAEEMFKRVIEINHNNYGAYIEIGCIYHEQGNFKEAEEMFKRVIEINPNNYEAHTDLGWIYEQWGRFKEAENMLRKAIEINPNDYKAYLGLGRVYQEQGKLKQAEEMFKRVIEINHNNYGAYIDIGFIYHEQGVSDKEIEEFYRKNGFLFKITENISLNSITKYHYQKLYKELNKRGIEYITMQYPTLNIDELKNMFEGNENITFVSNEENFKKALKQSKYEDYFIDRFAEDFGHATLKGNKLIAENVANVILTYLKSED